MALRLSCRNAEPDPNALRPIEQAIETGCAKSVRRAVKTAKRLGGEDALRAMHKAYIHDLNAGRNTALELDSGLLRAVFRGLHLAQSEVYGMSETAIDDNNNAVTTLASAAAKYDDPRLVELLLRWEPGFTMAQRNETTGDFANGAETTASFFMDMDAPRCAAWTRANHPDGHSTHEEDALLERHDARLRKRATAWIRKLKLKHADCETDTVEVAVRRSLLHSIKATGTFLVSDDGRCVFTAGMCLLGLPELMHFAKPQDDIEKLSESMRGVAMDLLIGKPPELDTSTTLGDATTLVQVVAPFAPLRKGFKKSVWPIRL